MTEFMGCLKYGETARYVIDYQHFLPGSPSAFYATDFACQRFEDAGFTPQNEKDPWDASPDGYVMPRSGTVAAWVVPETSTEDTDFRIVGAHTNSPAFHVEPSIPSTSPDSFRQIDVEVYGGILWNSWPDCKLAIAGHLLMRNGS